MNKYRLLKDCPHGKAGSVWKEHHESGIYKHLEIIDSYGPNRVIPFPLETFSDWFEKIEETLYLTPSKFTNKQARQIALSRQLDVLEFHQWLNENTEQ